MDDNTLLKVLEQLLHKIKANRRREIFKLQHAMAMGRLASSALFLWKRMLDANSVGARRQTDPRAENQLNFKLPLSEEITFASMPCFTANVIHVAEDVATLSHSLLSTMTVLQ